MREQIMNYGQRRNHQNRYMALLVSEDPMNMRVYFKLR